MTTAGDEHLTVTRLIRAERDRVFAAWIDPAEIVHWWGAGGVTCPMAEVDLRTGGTYRIANKTPDGQLMWITGTFLHVEPPSRLEYTWTMEPATADSHHSVVEVTFDDGPEGTTVTISQTKIADGESREIHLQGWLGCLEGLDRLLTTEEKQAR